MRPAVSWGSPDSSCARRRSGCAMGSRPISRKKRATAIAPTQYGTTEVRDETRRRAGSSARARQPERRGPRPHPRRGAAGCGGASSLVALARDVGGGPLDDDGGGGGGGAALGAAAARRRSV